MSSVDQPDPEPAPRVEPAHRSRRDASAPRASAAADRSVGPVEPVVDIRPPRWFAATCVAAAVVFAVLGIVATVAGIVSGDPLASLASVLGGAGLAVMAYDASRRSARSDGDVLVVKQWFRSVTLHRDAVEEFAAARASFVRWDIVAVPVEGTQVRLWVTRMLPAGRARRQGWLSDLEAWRTWVGPSGPR